MTIYFKLSYLFLPSEVSIRKKRTLNYVLYMFSLFKKLNMVMRNTID